MQGARQPADPPSVRKLNRLGRDNERSNTYDTQTGCTAPHGSAVGYLLDSVIGNKTWVVMGHASHAVEFRPLIGHPGVGDSVASIEWGIGDSVTSVPREARPPRTSDMGTGSLNHLNSTVCLCNKFSGDTESRFSSKSDLGGPST